MAANAKREVAPLPDVRCPLASTIRGSHEWAPKPSGSYYCTACLATLTASDVEDWKLLLEIETQRGQTTLSGEAFQVFTAILSDAVALSPGERRLLLRLAAEPAYVIAHDDLGEAIWGTERADFHDRTALRQQVTALRRKLTKLRLGVAAVPGVGYRLASTCDIEEPDRPAN